VTHSLIFANRVHLTVYDSPLTVRSCGLLDVPRSKKSNYGYIVGTHTTITECRIGQLQGTGSYTCVATSNTTQEWSPAVDAVCSSTFYRWSLTVARSHIVCHCNLCIMCIIYTCILLLTRRMYTFYPPHLTHVSPLWLYSLFLFNIACLNRPKIKLSLNSPSPPMPN